MRKIESTTQFKRDYKRESKGKHRNSLEHDFLTVVKLLLVDYVLEKKYRDHALSGIWSDHSDCHILPDLVLIYRKPDDETIQLVRLGSHSELGI